MKRAFRRATVPLAFYYAVTLALPLANGAMGSAFLEHAAVVVAVPPALILLFCVVRGIVLLLFRRRADKPDQGYAASRLNIKFERPG
jgi:hypothetical protein